MEEYTIVDSLKDELDVQQKRLDLHNKRYPDSALWRNIYAENIRSLVRIIDRYENGIDYEFQETPTGYTFRKKETTRHLEREFPEVAESAQKHRELVEQAKVMKQLKDP